MNNQMGRLGDYYVGTKPPLSIRITPDPTKPHYLEENGLLQFCIGSVQFFCNGNSISETHEQQIATALMLYGGWNETNISKFSESDPQKLEYIEFSFEPCEKTENQQFEIINSLSYIISSQYGDLTAPSGKVERLTPDIAPGLLGFVIPENYSSESLPLWRMRFSV